MNKLLKTHMDNALPTPVLVYITCANSQEANEIANAAVEKRLAACSNVIEGINSIYKWQGKLENSRGCLCLMKSMSHCLEKLEALVKSMHSYDLPCFIVLPVLGGSKEFLEWIKNECLADITI